MIRNPAVFRGVLEVMLGHSVQFDIPYLALPDFTHMAGVRNFHFERYPIAVVSYHLSYHLLSCHDSIRRGLALARSSRRRSLFPDSDRT